MRNYSEMLYQTYNVIFRSFPVMVIFGQNEIGIGQNGLYYNINIYLYYNIG